MNTEEKFVIGKKFWFRFLRWIRPLFLSVVFLFFLLPLHAGVINVSSRDKITTIKQAVEIATDGDTIMINGGIYKEKNIVVKKKITLLGKNNPVLDGEGTYEILTIKDVAGVVVSGLTFQHSGFSSLKDLAAIKDRQPSFLNYKKYYSKYTFCHLYCWMR